jgi:hypothetical protein
MVAAPRMFATPTSPNRAHRAIPHVDGAAWPCHLRAAPSRTSPGSAIKSRNPSFEGLAPRDRPLRREINSSRRAGKRRDGFTPRLLALRIAGLSEGDGKPPRPTRHQTTWLSTSIFSVLCSSRSVIHDHGDYLSSLDNPPGLPYHRTYHLYMKVIINKPSSDRRRHRQDTL